MSDKPGLQFVDSNILVYAYDKTQNKKTKPLQNYSKIFGKPGMAA